MVFQWEVIYGERYVSLLQKTDKSIYIHFLQIFIIIDLEEKNNSFFFLDINQF